MAENFKPVSENNLDLSEVSNEETDKLAQMIEQFYRQDTSVKAKLAYHWDRNHKFLDGDQWLYYEGNRESGGQWRTLQVLPENEYIPRPVTNYIFDGYQTLKSYLIKNKPRSSVRPNTQNFEDKTAAKIGDLCLEANWERLKETENYEYAASCGLLHGTVFKKSYWDTSSATPPVKVPRMTVGPDGRSIPALDPLTGAEIYDELPLGDVNTRVVEAYRIALDPKANNLHEMGWILEYSLQSIDWIKSTYLKEEEGYTGLAMEVVPDTKLQGPLRRLYDLKASSGVKEGGPNVDGSANAEVSMGNSAVLKEYYEAPSAQYPKGRLVVVANGKTLYAGDSPCEGPELGDWHPYSEFRWELVPGRFWGKSPMDIGCEIQKRINSIDAVITLTRKTMAVPQKLVPTTAGVPSGFWTGRPGQEIPYRPGDGAKPEIIPGVGVDQSVFQERAQAVQDLKEVMGNMDILKGDRPPGVTAASALNMLYEVGTGKLFPTLDRWKRFVESDQKKQLRLIAKNYKEPREDFISLLISRNSDLSESAVNKFIGKDLLDNCNVVVEAGSNIPKLQAAKQAMLQESAQTGVLNLELPANRIEYQRQMGIQGFDNDVGPDIKRAEWENDCLDNIEREPAKRPIVLQVDDDDIHMEVLARRMKEPKFMDFSAEVQAAYNQHYMEHMQSKNEKEQSAMLAAAASGQPAGPSPSAGAPRDLHRAGKGATSEMKNALGQDAMIPGAVRE